jgi:aldehyde dehydrogenase
MTVYAQPGQEGGRVELKARYENWIGGESVAPTQGQYFAGVTPITGRAFTEMAAGTAGWVGLALDAAHTAAPGRGRTPGLPGRWLLNRIAGRFTAWAPASGRATTTLPTAPAATPRPGGCG